jgi:hypothetical protein
MQLTILDVQGAVFSSTTFTADMPPALVEIAELGKGAASLCVINSEDRSACVSFLHQGEEDLTINGAPCGAPTAVAGADIVTECASPEGAPVTLDASASSDPNSTPGTNDDIVLFEWFEDFGLSSETSLGHGAQLSVGLPLGAHDITLRATDTFGVSDTDQLIVTIRDTTPPALSVELTPHTLWPPNDEMVPVAAIVAAVDACGESSVLLEQVWSDEPDDAAADRMPANDIHGAEVGTADFQSELRAERSRNGDGRVYTAVYRAVDSSGNAVSEAGFTVVPHEQGGVVDPIELVLDESPSGTILRWKSVPSAVTFDVIRGDLARIKENAVVTDLGPVVCIENDGLDLATIGHEDALTPHLGSAFFYLVGYFNGTSTGYGAASSKKPRAPGGGDCE